jgi:cobalt/nickel transport system permease protein
LIGNLFLRSYERSERVYMAMLARGYDGQLRLLNPPHLTWQAIWQGSLPLVTLITIELISLIWWT